MTKIEIHLFYDENGKAYNLCNTCGTKYRFKGGSPFCKPECKEKWAKIRAVETRKQAKERSRKYNEQVELRKKLNEPMREAQEKLRVERAKRIAELRAKAGKMLKDRKKYGNYKGPRAGKRWR
jgi:uncharacterized Zn finger protein (UPF0148 family)